MWTRELLKTNAKQALQGRYWRSFWICLVLSFVGLGGAGANSGNAARQAVNTVTDDTTAYDIINSIPDSMLGAILVGMLIGSIAALCWALFVVYPLKEMMEGEKWNFFILKLSFFGWLLLCVFTFGIGGFFLEPYMQATYAEFYAAMRSKALAMGMTTTDELGGFVRHDTNPNDMDF